MANDDENTKKSSGNGKTDDKIINPSSPYYIHPSDLPRQVQVNELLNDNNYNDWIQEMTNFLFSKNKINFVDGSVPKPEKTGDMYMPWMRCDAMIKGWLTTAMEKEIRGSVKYANTAAEIWKDLQERFEKESASRAYELKQSLTITRQEGSSVSAYYTKLQGLWDEIHTVLPTPRCTCSNCSCEIGKRLSELKEKECLYEFLMGLDAEFSTIRTQRFSMKQNPKLGEAYRMASEDEQQRSIMAGNRVQIESAVFQANYRGGFETQQKKKEIKRSGNNEDSYCTFCKREGHKREGCFKLVGYLERWPGKKNEKTKSKAACVDNNPKDIKTVAGLTDEQYETLLKHFSEAGDKGAGEHIRKANMAGKVIASSSKSDDCIVDSGSTDYVVYEKNHLENIVKKIKNHRLLFQMEIMYRFRRMENARLLEEQKLKTSYIFQILIAICFRLAD
ncbi:uncharacterized protein LOC110876507 [Helianthus annuus]|uniref:uncharacterized protein LOC110876507 n=1 Tax=Helianthus annuus TaxID=4232 RepID=UPI000B8EFC3A|nr:uncharacterized protein LOC110876507 [Helianthus annuus]